MEKLPAGRLGRFARLASLGVRTTASLAFGAKDAAMSRPEQQEAAQEAGQNRKKSRQRKRLLLEPDADRSAKDGDNNLTKALGSPDYQTRDKVGRSGWRNEGGGGCICSAALIVAETARRG